MPIVNCTFLSNTDINGSHRSYSMPSPLTSRISCSHVAVSSTAVDRLYSKDSRPPFARDLARISNTLSEMLLSEGRGHTLSDYGSLLKNTIVEAQALHRRLREAINSDMREFNAKNRHRSANLINQTLVSRGFSHFVLHENNILKSRPPRISHCIKMVTSSVYRGRVNSTKKCFGGTNSITIKNKLDEKIARLNEDLSTIRTNIWAVREQYEKVGNLLKDLRKIDRPKSKKQLPPISNDWLNHRASI